MKRGLILYCLPSIAGTLFLGLGGALAKSHASPDETGALYFRMAVPMPEVAGEFDFMAADVKGRRLFVAAKDNNTVEVIDLASGTLSRTLTGFNKPQWIVYRPDTHRLYISNGGDGSVCWLDSRTFRPVGRCFFEEKANNLHYDDATHELFVGVGKTFGAIGILDTDKNVKTGEIKLAAYPKQFVLDGNRVYVNVPTANHVAVIDRTQRKVIETWPINGLNDNTTMGFDRGDRLLFIGCPSGKLIVLDARSGRSILTLPIDDDVNGIYYDSFRHALYLSCGTGYIDIVRQLSLNQYRMIERMPTALGAATSLFIPELNLVCLPVPRTGKLSAELRLYNVTQSPKK